MILKRLFVMFLVWVAGICLLNAQNTSSSVGVDFRVGSKSINPNIFDNSAQLDKAVEMINNINADSTMRIVSITFSGTASPEGSNYINDKLSSQRSAEFESLLRSRVAIPDSIIRHKKNGIAWDGLVQMLEQSNVDYKDDAIAIIKSDGKLVKMGRGEIDNRVLQLKKLYGGKPWYDMLKNFFPYLRTARAVIVTEDVQPIVASQPVATEPEKEPEVIIVANEEPTEEVAETVSITEIIDKPQRWSLKTNFVGWAMLISNVAVELQTAEHWSVTLPIYYSALNYFTSTIKFRTLAFQPEVRYWLKPSDGAFIGTHLGVAWWNYALNGEYRRQDHKGHSPAFGGGLSIGWRKPIFGSDHWKMEFSAGAGVYRLYYDKFLNVGNGPEVGTVRKTWIGLDNLAASLVYTF